MSYRVCMRCCVEPANPVLCTKCTQDVKAEFQKLIEEISQYVITVEDLDADTRC